MQIYVTGATGFSHLTEVPFILETWKAVGGFSGCKHKPCSHMAGIYTGCTFTYTNTDSLGERENGSWEQEAQTQHKREQEESIFTLPTCSASFSAPPSQLRGYPETGFIPLDLLYALTPEQPSLKSQSCAAGACSALTYTPSPPEINSLSDLHIIAGIPLT